MRSLAAAVLALTALAGGCGKDATPEVRVFAGSSLTDVLQTLARDYEKETGVGVKLNLASSSTLAKQIVEGARCDLFISADVEWTDHVLGGVRRLSVDPGRRVLLTNRLVVVLAKPPAGPIVLSGDLEALAKGVPQLEQALLDPLTRRIAVGDPEHVPAGRYARRGLETMGIWEECRERLVPCESVRAALALVRSGEADAGIVYRTDAVSSGLEAVRGVGGSSEFGSGPGMAELPGVEARIVAVPMGAAASPGSRFLAWLEGDRATAVFRSAGFGIPARER